MYNVEKYLKRCVESIIGQSYSNLEILLIDDGSTDKSGVICDQFQYADPRIEVLHKENGGLSSARNAGLKIAAGDYVTFVDSDDWIELNIYEECIRTILKYGCDVVDFKAEFAKDERPFKQQNVESVAVVEGEDILYDYLYRGQTEKCPFSVCRKVYRKILYNGICFPEGKVNEDIATNFKVLQKSRQLVHISNVGYYYYQGNEDSITSGFLKKKDFDLLDASRELCELSSECINPEINRLAEIKLARSYFSLLAKAATGGASDDLTKKDKNFLIKNLRKNYRLLMRSPMQGNRKVLVTAFCISYNLTQFPLAIHRRMMVKNK